MDIDFAGGGCCGESDDLPPHTPPPSGDGQQLPAMTYFQLCVGDKRLKTWLVDYYGAKGLVRQAFWTSYAGLEHGPEEFMFSCILLLPFISLLKKNR